MTPTTLVITMAGFGTRFRAAGYSEPKYQIAARGRTLFAWSMRSLEQFARAGSRFVFVVRAADDASAFVHAQCELLGIARRDLVELDAPTDGQATTVLRAQALLSPGEPLGIYNIDTYVDPDCLNPGAITGDGWIPCFPGPGEGWSFALADPSGRIVEVREKVRISADATVGFYWFRSFELYRSSYETYYSDPARMEKGERYVAPLYNQLIADGRDVRIARVPFEAVCPLGTPEEVRRFAQAPT